MKAGGDLWEHSVSKAQLFSFAARVTTLLENMLDHKIEAIKKTCDLIIR